MAVASDDDERVFMLGEGGAALGDGVTRLYRDERSLIEAFCRHIRQLDPDALIGWNVVEFDLQFLQARCDSTRLI